MTLQCPPAPSAPTQISDALSDPAPASLLHSVIAQSPRGAAWRTDENQDAGDASFQHRFWRAVCDPLAAFYAKMWRLALASTACTLSGPEDAENNSLDDWEFEFGLPDPCYSFAAFDVATRKKLLRVRVGSEGGQSRNYFICLAQQLGYAITIKETTVFRCGEGRCGKTPLGGPVDEVTWHVYVTTQKASFFRCGVSSVGRDRLGEFGPFYDLECLLTRAKPAHTQIKFHYVYVGSAPPPFA